MATEGERLAVVEQRVAQMWEWINGGPSTRYEDSARGRLHELMTNEATAKALADALREMRRDRGRQWSTGKQIVLFGCALLTTACAIIAALATLGVL